MPTRVSCTEPGWQDVVQAAVVRDGCVVVADALEEARCLELREGMYAAQRLIVAEIGAERLAQARELGVLRLLLKYEPLALGLLELEPLLEIVDTVLGETSILHLQNGFILPPTDVPAQGQEVFQQSFHRDFPRHLNGYLASLNIMLAVDPFTAENGGTLVVPKTHQLADTPDRSRLADAALPVECSAGSLIVFDSTLWHAAGINRSHTDRVAVNHQFTRSFIKQQVDYVRALGDEAVLALPERSQQLLGWYTRVVTSLDEYYQPTESRLYRSGQG